MNMNKGRFNPGHFSLAKC